MGIDRSFKFGTAGFGDDGKSGIPATFFRMILPSGKKNDGHNDVGLPTVNAKAMK
jgi:hypothetical protein